MTDYLNGREQFNGNHQPKQGRVVAEGLSYENATGAISEFNKDRVLSKKYEYYISGTGPNDYKIIAQDIVFPDQK